MAACVYAVYCHINLTMLPADSQLSTNSSMAALAAPYNLYPYVIAVLIFAFFVSKNFLIKKIIIEKNQSKLFPLPPGPKPWPIIGNLPEMLTNRPTFRWLLGLLADMDTNIGCVRIGNVHIIPVICPKIGLEFLREQDATFASRPETISTRIFSRNNLTVIFPPNCDQWKKMKRMLKCEILSPERHNWMHQKRVEEADNLIKYVYHQVSHPNGTVNLRSVCRHYAGNVIRKMMFNKRHFGPPTFDGGPGVAEEEHVRGTFLTLKYLYNFCISDYFPFLEGLDLDGHEKQVKLARRMISKYHDPIVDERIQQKQNDDKREPQDLLDVMISLKDSNGNPLLSSEEIKAQSAEIMIAAIDNPSNAVEWALAEMINQPVLLKKAVEELDRVVGRDRLVQESDILKLNYVKACLREAFRLHPVAPFNPPHVAMADAVVAGYFIPKGSHVILSRVGIGRNPDVWEEPLKFKPERHLLTTGAEVALTEHNLSIISFSTGRRGCIASTLGTCMTVMLMARLLQGFEWTAPPSRMDGKLDLCECFDELSLATPLVARGVPRLPVHLYHAVDI